MRENLDPQGLRTDSEILNAIQKTELNIKKPLSLQNNIDENLGLIGESRKESQDLDLSIANGGKNLSNGERQIINFLRIILLNYDIICLDEATSNMDPSTGRFFI